MNVSSRSAFAQSMIRKYVIIMLIALIFISISAKALTPAVNSTHFIIYDLANAGLSYDQA